MADRYTTGDEIGDRQLVAEGDDNSGLLIASALVAAVPGLLLIAFFPVVLPFMVVGVIGLGAWARLANRRKSRLAGDEIGEASQESGTWGSSLEK